MFLYLGEKYPINQLCFRSQRRRGRGNRNGVGKPTYSNGSGTIKDFTGLCSGPALIDQTCYESNLIIVKVRKVDAVAVVRL